MSVHIIKAKKIMIFIDHSLSVTDAHLRWAIATVKWRANPLIIITD